MNRSKYVGEVNINDNYVYHNYLTGKIISSKLPLEQLERESCDSLQESEGFLDTPEKERDRLRYWLSKFQYSHDLQITVVLEESCNICCSYCYQGRKIPNRMTKHLANKVVEFVRIRAKYAKNIHIEFYGGEPLLNTQILLYLAQTVHQFAIQNCIRFSFGIMTNGTLLDHDIVPKLIGWGLSDVQFTLDGPERVHDRFRKFKNGRGTFATVVANIRKLSESIRPQVRVNICEDNVDTIPELFAYLRNESLQDRMSIYCTPIITTGIDLACSRQPCQMSGELARKISAILDAAYDFDFGHKAYSVGRCHYYQRNSFVIDTEGDIYKCFALPETKIGNIGGSMFGVPQVKCLETPVWNKCDPNCEVLPVCLGGCRYKAKVSCSPPASSSAPCHR